MLSMNGTEIPITRLTTKQYGRKIERTEGCDTTDNSLTSGDNPDLLGLPVQSTSSPSEGRRPKGIKYWLKDPHVFVNDGLVKLTSRSLISPHGITAESNIYVKREKVAACEILFRSDKEL
ncbi:hypothetical protein pdam_00019322 [Pocillopora damicornis]|uniref:Uncharacterized protein n=1 Tax=Pocillopora damicornis TaxID=46731 RepID=A0A3M6U1N1_POCDA|nr:hypothetical protein pdam_00019322 [Pocillopora damicornis]